MMRHELWKSAPKDEVTVARECLVEFVLGSIHNQCVVVGVWQLYECHVRSP